MKLLNSKIIKGEIADTYMKWFCGEFETCEKTKYVGCFDVTLSPKTVFLIRKGQPPEKFDFKDVYPSFEQVAMAQLTVMEWDKLRSGDKITLDDEMEEKIRKWEGRIWMGGSETIVEQKAPGIFKLKTREIPERGIGHYIYYMVKNEEY